MATVVNPPEPEKPSKGKQSPDSLPLEKPRRTKTVDGVKYVLVNGGWRRAEGDK